MSPDLNKLTAENLIRWHSCKVIAGMIHALDDVAERIVASKGRYVTVSLKTNVPWAVIGVIHEREASGSWTANLANGEAWSHITHLVPKGRGPFSSWEAAATDALVVCPPHAAHWEDWSIGGALCLLEQYNGLGYFAMHMPSPYIWASTNQYIRGKYVSDHHFDPHAIDHQLGCAALLLRMSLMDSSISKDWHP